MSAPLLPSCIEKYLATPTEAERQFRRLFLADERLVICNIGACEGEDSVRFSRLFPRARIYAFELLPANQALVRANFNRYSAVNAELVPAALSDRAGEASCNVSSGRAPDLFAGENWNYGNKSSSLLPPVKSDPMHGWIEFNERITVTTTTLDQFCADRNITRIDFIQMDVQGAEKLVLAGAARMLARTTAVWLEVSAQELYRGQALDRDLTRLMRAEGFFLAHTAYLGTDHGEGDHLYLNLRRLRVWPALIKHALQHLLRFARRCKRALPGKSPAP